MEVGLKRNFFLLTHAEMLGMIEINTTDRKCDENVQNRETVNRYLTYAILDS